MADVDKFSAAEKNKISHMILRVGVGALLPAEGSDDVDEPPVVLDASLGTSGLLFLLLAGLNFWGLSANLTSTSQGSVNLSSEEWDCVKWSITVHLELFISDVIDSQKSSKGD